MRSIARLPVFLMALIICVCSLMPMSAFAAGTVGGGNAVFSTENQQSNNGSTNGGGTNSDKYGYIPSASEALGLDRVPEVDTDDVQNWVDRKGGELILLVFVLYRLSLSSASFSALFSLLLALWATPELWSAVWSDWSSLVCVSRWPLWRPRS